MTEDDCESMSKIHEISVLPSLDQPDLSNHYLYTLMPNRERLMQSFSLIFDRNE